MYIGTHWDEKFIDEPPQFLRDSSKLFYEKTKYILILIHLKTTY